MEADRIQCFWCEPVEPAASDDATAERRPWRRVDTGEVFQSVWDLPAGAMWNAPWWAFACVKHADGRCIAVMLPDRCVWLLDQPPAGQTRAWERTGEPPSVTARPSILTPKYHGWLTDGVLTRC